MGIFDQQIAFLDSFEKDIYEELRKTINAFDFVLTDYITNKQLFREGIDGNEKKLEGYKRLTIRIKLRKGDPVDRTTLRDEGDFYDSIQVDAFSNRFEVTSNVSHDKYIVKRYGENVLKITNENLREFMIRYFLPNFKKKTNVKFT